MNGRSAIVVNINNSYPFHDHATIADAKKEAHRLAAMPQNENGVFVVFVPVAVVTRVRPTTEEAVTVPESEDAELPF